MPLLQTLSLRELDVYALLYKGLLDRDMSRQLNLSIETIKKHNKNIYLKLHVRNRTEAVLLKNKLKK